jgi:mannose-6-phosphate isomerase-like protein (cupin superfamily)
MTSTTDLPSTEFLGTETGQDVAVIIIDTDVDGAGPALHLHPYAETFVLVSGTVHFWVGDRDFVAEGPSCHTAPPQTPHRFAVVGPGRVRMVDIHANPTFVTTWL